jgi:hypothetical protein
LKQIKIDITDLISLLEDLHEGGIHKVIIFELGGLPAIADAEDPEGTIVTFSTDESEESEGGLH